MVLKGTAGAAAVVVGGDDDDGVDEWNWAAVDW